jgi:hypothetical protein
MENSNFIDAGELLNYINEAYFTWYDTMVEAYEDYYLPAEPVVFNLPNGTDGLFDLPADFYKLAGLDRSISSGNTDRFYPMKKTPWRGRTNTENTFRYALTANVTYRIFKSKIQMTPRDSANGTYQLWYIPTVTPLVDDSDVVETFNGFENLLIVDVAIKMLLKEESDPSFLMLERDRLTDQLNLMKIDRDINNGERIEEVYDSGQGYGPTGDFW